MRKITVALMLTLSVATISSSFAADKDKGKKEMKKCSMGSCCKKTTSKAALLKAKPAAAKKA